MAIRISGVFGIDFLGNVALTGGKFLVDFETVITLAGTLDDALL